MTPLITVENFFAVAMFVFLVFLMIFVNVFVLTSLKVSAKSACNKMADMPL